MTYIFYILTPNTYMFWHNHVYQFENYAKGKKMTLKVLFLNQLRTENLSQGHSFSSFIFSASE